MSYEELDPAAGNEQAGRSFVDSQSTPRRGHELRRHSLLKLSVAIISSLLSLVAVEIGLRLSGRPPFFYFESSRAAEETASGFDTDLGWIVPPGDHSREFGFRTLILEDGSRATSTKSNDSATRIVTVGGSFTFGTGVPDEETFAWGIQAALPQFQVRNYGTGGYGSYQSLLRLERYFSSAPETRLIIYGYINHHQHRNVASASWMRMIEQYSRRLLSADVPYCTWDEQKKRIVRESAPRQHPRFPMRESSSLVAVLEGFYLKLGARNRTAARGKITAGILNEMQELGAANGARFVVLLLDAIPSQSQERKTIVELMESSGVDYVDCMTDPDAELALGDGHPNAKRHSQYTQCVLGAIRERGLLSEVGAG